MFAPLRKLMILSSVVVSLSACGHSDPETMALLGMMAAGMNQGIAQGTATHYQRPPQVIYQAPPQAYRPLPTLTNCQKTPFGTVQCTTVPR